MTSVLSAGVGPISITSVPLSSGASSSHITTTDIIIIASVASSLVLVAVVILILRRSRKKYRHPEDKSNIADTVESAAGVSLSDSKSYQDSWRPIFEHGRTIPFLTRTTQTQSFNPYLMARNYKDGYAWPSSFVNDYKGQEIHQTHIVSLDSARCRGDTEPHKGFEFATLHSARPTSLNPLTNLPYVMIPETPLNHSNESPSIKRNGSRQSSKTLDSILGSEDSVSLYSEASAYVHTPYSSKSVLETTIPPPVPSIPLRFSASTQSTLPQSVDLVTSAPRQEVVITKPSLPSTFPSPPLPLLRLYGDEEEQVDDTEIYNVAKLLQSRQLRLPSLEVPNPPGRNPSIISHIERSGSIKPLLPPTGEQGPESYRPRYHRLKQKKNTRSSYGSNFSATHLRDSFVSPFPSPYPPDSRVVGLS